MRIKRILTIRLFKNRGIVRVSRRDYANLIQYSWALACGKYAIASFDKGKRRVYMHRFILGVTDPKVQVDHRDGDTLNNCRSNLRKATNKQNTSSQKVRKNTVSGYKGVHHFPRNKTNPWMASITHNYKHIHLGYFPTPEKAAVAYNEKAAQLFKEFAKLNDL